ncbi:MAG: DUF2505 family protein [Actinophytocola sp.]|uniref:DUF2505 domain-containing protein n=1 Tax=Actinophytocola sp. TaxID=1872138 RepID=UPI00132352C1|nr:DUF2505 domain-containing protein [Actinophytocola sp.]MPZ79769.1 DUF2505 family protein [Actinophytocola sp.]
MASSLEHRSTYPAPATVVYSTLVDEAFLTERLRAVGGKGASLLDHSLDGSRATFRMRQGVDASRLPGAVRSILNGDLVVERHERWESAGESYAGTSRVTISGVPGEIHGRSRIAATGTGSALVVTAQVAVNIPLIGGKLEKVVAEQVGKLLATEAEFAEKWLAEHA